MSTSRTSSNSLRVALAGGGTAGHILPGLAVASELLARGSAPTDMLFLISKRKEDADLLAETGFAAADVRGKGIPRSFSPKALASTLSILAGVLDAWRLLGRHKTEVVFLQGGFVSASCAIAARLRRLPCVVFEANSQAGMASRLSARWASTCATAFANTNLPKAIHTGTPLRREIAALANSTRRATRSQPPGESATDAAANPRGTQPFHQVLVLGGSLGSGRINKVVREAAENLLASGKVKLRHVVGTRAWQQEDWSSLSVSSAEYEVLAYETDMASALAAADLVVSRAGGGALAELTAAARPSILIPFEASAESHQLSNAKRMAEAGAAVLLPESELSAESLTKAIETLLSQPSQLSAMARSAASLARPDAAARVADLLEAQVAS